MASIVEIDAMRRALAAARLAPRTLPNPPVGCVLLSPAGEILAVGHHRGAGHPHAEIEALHAVGDEARGATAVVTLEPCRHQGRTGPCADALLEAGIRRVVHASNDPNTLGAGGAEVLRDAGVDVEGGVLVDEGDELIAIWAQRHRLGRPFVTWKFAATFDGRSAAPDGTSQWITGPEARRDVHALRAECDAIVVGTGTVLSDNPRLTARDELDEPLPRSEQPRRVVVGHRAIPNHFHVHDDTAPTAFLAEHEPATVLAQLAELDVHHVWLEGGPHLAGAWLDAGVIDRVISYLAPSLLGAGTPAVMGRATTLNDRRNLDITQVSQVGTDLRIIATPVPDGRATRKES